ncbi:MAG TPA: ATP-binding protein [Candidatus Omnitrophota bacterium]|nr:ATP-binding protein [Candidatus Omnitrophota bacterium]
MNSLRVRLIVGFALVALVPLAIAIVLLTDRIERMVRDQAADRVTGALQAVTTQLAEDERRIVEKAQLLAQDPELRRLYLVRGAGARDLADFLEERRFLLGLDFLRVTDVSGALRADAADAVSRSASPARPARYGPAPPGRRGISVRRLESDSGLVVVAAAPIQYLGATTGHVECGLALDAGFLERWRDRSGVELGLFDAQGRVAGGSAPLALPSWASGSAGASGRYRLVGTDGSDLYETVPLAIGDPPFARLVGAAGTSEAEAAITALQRASAILGLIALGVAIVLGFAWSRQISRPVERLAGYSEQLARGEWDQPLELKSVRELETLVVALDRMRRDLLSYRERLVVTERQAAWSQMARKVAHEVKNPLTPIAISIADLKRSYESKRPDFPAILDQAVRTIGEEVETLKRLLQEFSDFGRFPPPRIEPCRWSGLAADLETLYGDEIRSGRLAVSPEGRGLVFPADAGQVRQALVNLIRNGLDATAGGGRVLVGAAAQERRAVITVADDGPGLSQEQRARLFTPGFTTKPEGSGLGLTIVERIVNDHGGTIDVRSAPGQGTTFTIRLPLQREA